MGGQVTCIDLSTKNDSWDVVPNCTFDWKKKEKEHMNNELQKVQNAFWFAHRAQKSNSKVINSHIYNLPEETEMHDIGMMGLVLLLILRYRPKGIIPEKTHSKSRDSS